MYENSIYRPPSIAGSPVPISALDAGHGRGNAPRGFVYGLAGEAFVRKRVIEFNDIPFAAAPLEITLGVACDVMVYSDFPVNIGYGQSSEFQSIGVLQARYTGVSNVFRFAKYFNVDYGRLVIYYATPSLGVNFRRPDPNDCLTMELDDDFPAGWAGGAVNEVWAGPGNAVAGHVEAIYYRSIMAYRTAGTIEGVNIIETESGIGNILYPLYEKVASDRFYWYFEKPIRCSARHSFTFVGSNLPAVSGYGAVVCYHVI